MRRHLPALFAAMLLLAACGGSSSDPGGPSERLADALDELERSEATTVRLTLESTVGSLQALAEAGGDRLGAAAARRILASSVTASTTTPEDALQARSQVLVEVDGADVVEIRMVADVAYLRVDAARLFELLGRDPSEAGRLAEHGEAAGLSFARPLVEGRWVALRGLRRLGGTSQGPSARQKQAVRALVAALGESTTVTSEGMEGRGEHLVAAVSARDLHGLLRGAAQLAGPTLPGAGLPGPPEAPDRDVRLDLWVDEGRLTQVELDLLQLPGMADEEVPPGVERLALRATLEDFSGEVEPPVDAVPVAVDYLMQSLLGLGGGPSGGGGFELTAP